MSAWYRSGTIAVAGKTVTGTGTNWTDNKMGIGPGQALLIPGAGTIKVYEIARVDSATQLTLTDDAGTVAAGQAYAIMSFYANSVPDFSRRLAAQLSYYQSQMDGWQDIMTGTGSITLEAPDGTQVTVSSFKKLTNDMGAKADKVDGAVPVTQGGTGSTTAAGALANLGAVATNDSRLGTINGKSGGTVNGGLKASTASPTSNPAAGVTTNSDLVGSRFRSGVYTGIDFSMYAQVVQSTGTYGIFQLLWGGSPTYWIFGQDGVARGTAWQPTCDERLKDLDGPVTRPLEKMKEVRGQTWKWKSNGAFGIGFTAQDVQKIFPEAVASGASIVLPDESKIDGVLSPDTYGVAAALHHESILSLMDILKSALEVIADSTSDTETREKLSAIAALIPEAGTVQKDNAVENQ